MNYKIELFEKKKVKIICFFCKKNKETIGYLYETSGEKFHYFFCKECLSEVLQYKIKDLKEDQVRINKEEFLMIASHHNYQARENNIRERIRFRKVSEIINKYIDIDELHEFQDNREDQFLK